MTVQKPWNYNSCTNPCGECDGTGAHAVNPHLRVGDPSYHEIDCDECEGSGHTHCEVCGFDVVIPGYDCLACQMVYDIPDNLLTDKVADALAEAVRNAISKARAANMKENAL